MIPKAITIDLRNGMGLEECLIKHNTNLKTLFNNTPSLIASTRTDEHQYIQKRGCNYYIKKKIMNKTYFYGIYRTLKDAQLVRDQLIHTGWKQNKVDSICKELNVHRIPGRNEVRYYE